MVDLLKKQCPVDKVTGILVLNAHRYWVIVHMDDKYNVYPESDMVYACVINPIVHSLQGYRSRSGQSGHGQTSL